MAAGVVGGGRIAALLTVAAVAVAALVPGASCRAVAPSGGEAELCVRRCARDMLACAAASGCASVTVTTGASRARGGEVEEERQGSGACGRGCENEYRGCIDVC